MPETVEIRMTKEELGYVLAGLVALRRDYRINAGADLCMARVVGKEGQQEVVGMIERADRTIVQSNEVSSLLERIKTEMEKEQKSDG